MNSRFSGSDILRLAAAEAGDERHLFSRARYWDSKHLFESCLKQESTHFWLLRDVRGQDQRLQEVAHLMFQTALARGAVAHVSSYLLPLLLREMIEQP